MKKSITRIVSVGILSAAAVLAQGPLDRGPGGAAPGSTSTTTPPTVASIVARQVSFLTTLLTLTTSQAATATTIFTNELNAITPIQTNITTAQTALAAAVKTNSASTIATQSALIGTLTGQIVALEANADAGFYALLTTAQQTTLGTVSSDFFGEGLGGIHIPGGGH